MSYIRGLKTTWSNEVVTFDKEDIFDSNWKLTDRTGIKLNLEVSRNGEKIRNHNAIHYYFWDNKLASKICVTLVRNESTKKYFACVHYYKGANDIDYYSHRQYDNFVGLPKKYYDIIKWIHPCFLSLFGE